MRLFITILGIISLTLLNSCSSGYETEIQKVEELSIRIFSLKNTFETVSMEDVNNAKDTYKKNMNKVKQYYSTDTIEYDFVHTMNLYKGIKKTDVNYDANKNNLETLRSQLENLKSDLINNTIPRDSAQYFIEFETANVDKLSEDVGTFISNCDYILETHNAYAEKVKNYTIAFK